MGMRGLATTQHMHWFWEASWRMILLFLQALRDACTL